ncbi:FK506-binding protein 15, partial [Coemansia sp. RSA 2322]
DKIAVHYEGKLFSSGTVFDSSLTRDQPIDFILGHGHVIQGWDQGLLGMCGFPACYSARCRTGVYH